MHLACPPSPFRALSAPALALACATTSLAQVELTGPLSDNTTGPLVSGTVYHATGALSVPSGATLTIPEDVIIKFPFNGGLTVDGTLNVNGPMTDSIIFTDIRDDTAGGDTNGDGAATTPTRAVWRGVQFNDGSDASHVQGLTVRFAGRSISAYELHSCDASFQICRAQQSGLHAFNLNTSSLPTLTSCSAEDCTQEAFTNVRIEGVPLLAGLSATGNGFDRVRVSNGSVPAATNLMIGTGDMIQNTIYLASNVVIPASSKLTVGPGSIIKFAFNTSVLVDGELELDGAPGERHRPDRRARRRRRRRYQRGRRCDLAHAGVLARDSPGSGHGLDASRVVRDPLRGSDDLASGAQCDVASDTQLPRSGRGHPWRRPQRELAACSPERHDRALCRPGDSERRDSGARAVQRTRVRRQRLRSNSD